MFHLFNLVCSNKKDQKKPKYYSWLSGISSLDINEAVHSEPMIKIFHLNVLGEKNTKDYTILRVLYYQMSPNFQPFSSVNKTGEHFSGKYSCFLVPRADWKETIFVKPTC